MKTDELIKALGRLKVQTGSLACLGCKHEDTCGEHGCALIREAVTQLIEQNGWVNPKERLPERGVPVLTYNCRFVNVDFVGPILVVGRNKDEFCDVPEADFLMYHLREEDKE